MEVAPRPNNKQGRNNKLTTTTTTTKELGCDIIVISLVFVIFGGQTDRRTDRPRY